MEINECESNIMRPAKQECNESEAIHGSGSNHMVKSKSVFDLENTAPGPTPKKMKIS